MSNEQKAPPYNKFMSAYASKNEDGGNHLEVFLNDTIADFWYYLELLHFLHESKDGDTCNITIDNRGGYLVTGIAIAEAIKSAKAHVTTIAVSIAASAAALIWTAGHDKIGSPWGYVMYHTASYLSMGNARKHLDKGSYINTLVSNIMQEALGMNLITKEDIEDIESRARDIFVAGDVINTRTQVQGINRYELLLQAQEGGE